MLKLILRFEFEIGATPPSWQPPASLVLTAWLQNITDFVTHSSTWVLVRIVAVSAQSNFAATRFSIFDTWMGTSSVLGYSSIIFNYWLDLASDKVKQVAKLNITSGLLFQNFIVVFNFQRSPQLLADGVVRDRVQEDDVPGDVHVGRQVVPHVLQNHLPRHTGALRTTQNCVQEPNSGLPWSTLRLREWCHHTLSRCIYSKINFIITVPDDYK